MINVSHQYLDNQLSSNPEYRLTVKKVNKQDNFIIIFGRESRDIARGRSSRIDLDIMAELTADEFNQIKNHEKIQIQIGIREEVKT